MAARIVIRHLAGSKVNQVEQFPADAAAELTIGREPGVEIQFDPLRDDAVSRQHAKIAIEPGDPPRFRMTDLDSRNGTFLNGERIVGETEVLPGDTIELGAGGPKFEFDVQPRPSNLFGRTRAIPVAAVATRVIDNAEREPSPTVGLPTVGVMSAEPPPKPGIGRNTLLHELSVQRQATRQIVIYALIGMLVVIGAVGGILYYTHQKSIAEQNARIADEKAQLEAQNAEAAKQSAALVSSKIDKKIGLTPQEVAEKFGDATVMVSVHWRLYDRATGKPLFHKTIFIKNKNGSSELLPAYVKWKGRYVRWLTLEDESHTNMPVGNCNCEVTATGFVVDSQGLILTNKHVVAGWLINYNRFAYYENKGRGIVFDAQDQFLKPQEKFDREEKHFFDLNDLDKDLIQWLPAEGGPIFANSQPVVIDSNTRMFEGRNEELSVRFPGTRADVSAQLVRASPDADVALIKIDAFETATHDVLADDDKVDIGEPVVVLGYPGVSVENRAIFDTVENAEVHHHNEIIPEPTVTSGVVSMKGSPLTKQGNSTLFGRLGEVYQMTVTASAGNSGGPVFDREGRVIGLFTYVTRRETETFAVPIKYGRELMQLQRIK
jgi:S1-C subfamily serine protease/pSer/pThr/pTyr-binding forkhead associated (FHA) protein